MRRQLREIGRLIHDMYDDSLRTSTMPRETTKTCDLKHIRQVVYISLIRRVSVVLHSVCPSFADSRNTYANRSMHMPVSRRVHFACVRQPQQFPTNDWNAADCSLCFGHVETWIKDNSKVILLQCAPLQVLSNMREQQCLFMLTTFKCLHLFRCAIL